MWVNFAVVTNSIEHSVWKLIPRMQTSAVIWHKGSSSCCKLTASVQMPTHYKKCEENSPTLQTDIQTTKTFHNFIRKPTAWQPCVVTTVNITTVHCTDDDTTLCTELRHDGRSIITTEAIKFTLLVTTAYNKAFTATAGTFTVSTHYGKSWSWCKNMNSVWLNDCHVPGR